MGRGGGLPANKAGSNLKDININVAVPSSKGNGKWEAFSWSVSRSNRGIATRCICQLYYISIIRYSYNNI